MAQSERGGAACEIDTLQDEFGVLAVRMSVGRHDVCCGSVRRFLKVARRQTQPWKLEVRLLFMLVCGTGRASRLCPPCWRGRVFSASATPVKLRLT